MLTLWWGGLGASPLAAAAEDDGGRLPQLQRKLQDDPEDRDALLALALEYSVRKQYGKAVETYFALLKVDPNNFHAYNNLGILYKKTGQYKDCLYCYQQARKINPDSYWVPYNMGLAYEAMGRMQEAREAYGQSLSLNPDFALALQRLRELSEAPGSVAPLPAPPGSEVLVADAPTGQPKPVGRVDLTPRPPAAGKPAAGKPAAEKPATGQPGAEKPAAEAAPSPAGKAPAGKVARTPRTGRTGPGASLFNQAMDALAQDDLNKAVDLYVRCVLADRDFLAEPDNGLIQKGLTHLQSRPNSMKDGLFFRGFFTAITGNLAAAVPDLKTYLEQGPNQKVTETVFLEEAQALVARHEREVAEFEALKARQASEAAILAEAKAAAARQASATATFTPRLDDVTLKQMDVDAIIDEANRLSRDARIRDAIAVLKVGLDKDPDNLRLLMASANAYTDLMFLKGDNEAGRMARDLFGRVVTQAPPDSKEAKLAQSFIAELDTRLGQ
ncbi:MAG: tetratricopeptide repeat protein [Candidatus Riflebacteria bacterium]|nr:tetratricopeptide repeat protein [Candidatus Riflebacteria bacterium]